MRSCVTCGTPAIDESKPDYVKHCIPCYKNYKDAMRECSMCHQKKIPSTSPEYMKKCRQCYLETKNVPTSVSGGSKPLLNTFNQGSVIINKSINLPKRKCVDCNQMNIDENEASYKVRCETCYDRIKYKEMGGLLDL